MRDLWPACGFSELERESKPDARGWLHPTPAYLRQFLAAPELALVPESCAAEKALNAALIDTPQRPVTPADLGQLLDPDARSNYATFVAFRDALLDAGTIEGYYLGLMRSGAVTVPPGFVDRLVQAIVRNVLDAGGDVFEARAAELLFRSQRVTTTDGRVLCADRAVVDMFNETAGFGDIGRLLVQGNAPVRAMNLQVLGPENAAAYWEASDAHTMLLDLTHELTTDLGHGLQFTMARAQSGLGALARVLARWAAHLLGVNVTITPLRKIDDDGWRWHIGLDVASMALLNDLYEDRPVDTERMRQLVSLFRLDFADRGDMRADVAGKPVYLGLATQPDGTLRLKPQNLLLNLPLASPM